MLRTNVLIIAGSFALLRQASPCSCVEESPCEYIETPLDLDYMTAWGTTLAEDIAMLETPQSGTWIWDENSAAVGLENAGAEFPVVATFVHDPQSVRFQEHVAGGVGTFCDDEVVLIDGTLTFTDDQGGVIVSIPITVQRTDMATNRYASAAPIPYLEFSTEVHPLRTDDEMLVLYFIDWFEDRGLFGEFAYFSKSMYTPTTGGGTSRRIALFEPDE